MINFRRGAQSYQLLVAAILDLFRTVSPVWNHRWLRNDAQSLKKHIIGALLFVQVNCQILRSHGSKNFRIWPKFGISGLYLQFEITNGYEMMHKASSSIEEVSYCFFKVIRYIARSHGSKNCRIWPKLGVSGLYLQFEITDSYEMTHKAWRSIEEVPYCFARSSVKFQGRTALKIVAFDPKWAFPDCYSSLNSLMAVKWSTKLGAT